MKKLITSIMFNGKKREAFPVTTCFFFSTPLNIVLEFLWNTMKQEREINT